MLNLEINTDLVINKVYTVETPQGNTNAKLINFGVSRFNNLANAVSLNFETETGDFINISDLSKVNEMV